MAIGYLDMVTHTRARGHSAAAAIAYRFGVLLVDVRTGAVHDYLERHTREDIADTGIEAYRDTPLVADAQTLANAIEGAERRRDARILRDWKVALPHELDEAQRIELTKTISRDIAKRYDTVIAWAVHRPRSDGDARNHHAHFVIPTRALDADGHLGAKLRVFDNPRTSGDEIAYLRNRHADLANLALERAGRDERIDVGQIVEGVPVESASHGLVAEARKSQRWPKRTAARDVISAAVAADGLESERAQRIAQAYRRRNARKPRQERYAESRRARWQRRSAVAELGDWLPPVIEPEAATTLDPVARPRHMPPIAAPTVISAPRRVERKPEADARPVRLPPAPAPAVAAAPRSVVVEPDARPRHIPPIAAPTVISAPRRVERKPEADARPVRMPPPLVPAVAAVHRVFELERDARPVRLPPAPAPAVAAAPRSVVADPDARPRSIPSALNADRSIAELRARARELMDSLEQAQAEIAPHQRRLAAYLEQHLDRIIGEMCSCASVYPGPPGATIELDGVPDSSTTPRAICGALAIAIANPITRIRAGKTHHDRLDSGRRIADEWRRDLDPATRTKIVADVTAEALPGYSAEWLPPVGDDDPRGREQRTALENELRAAAEVHGEARILGHAGVRVFDPIRDWVADMPDISPYADRARALTWDADARQIAPIIDDWRDHCRDQLQLQLIVLWLLDAIWPLRWKEYRRSRITPDPRPVPSRDKRDEQIRSARPSPDKLTIEKRLKALNPTLPEELKSSKAGVVYALPRPLQVNPPASSNNRQRRGRNSDDHGRW